MEQNRTKCFFLGLTVLIAIFLYSGCKEEEDPAPGQKTDAISMPRVYNLNADTDVITKSEGREIIPQEFLKNAKTARVFAINPALQRAEGNVQVNDVINLQLFENDTYRSTVGTIAISKSGNYTLTLKLPEYPMAYGMITTSTTGKSLFTLKIPELNRTFISRSSVYSNAGYLLEAEAGSELKCEKGGIPDDSTISGNENKNSQDGMQQASVIPASLTATDPARIDVMLVYTPAAAEWAASNEGGIANTIEGAMAQTSAIFDNQGDGDRINLVYSGKVNYIEHPDAMSTDLNNLTKTNDGYLDEVHQLRAENGADLVVLITKADDYGGIAWVLTNADGSPQYGFNVIRVQQTSWTTTSAHEMGHNLGMWHNRDQYTTEPYALYPYAFGWYWPGNDGVTYGSVMSYEGVEAPYYSNPDIIYKGGATGTDVANNAKVFRNTKHIVAAYYVLEGYIITASAGVGGSISPDGEQTVPQGGSKTFLFTADTGYEIEQVLVDGVSNAEAVSSKSYTFTNVTANHTISVSFKKKQYIVTVAVNPTVYGTAGGDGTYIHGTSCTVRATANNGYEFVNWTEKGSVISANADYTFTVSAARNLVANFTDIPVTLSSFSLNNGDEIALFRTARLFFTWSGGVPGHYMTSEKQDFSGAVWKVYHPSALTHTFDTETTGTKTVYIKLKNSKGETEVRSDQIFYKPAHAVGQTAN
ncbi:MAG: M12 family metallo-peptidase [Mangrovibacterium sp.]